MLRIWMLALTLVVTAGLLHCGSDSTGPGETVDDEPDWPENSVALPPDDAAALDSAAVQYTALRESMDAPAARLALLAALNDGFPDIDTAWLNPDSSTLQLRFLDGAAAVVLTDEVFHSTQDRGSMPGAAATPPRASTPAAFAGLRTSCGGIEITPGPRVHIVVPSGATDDAHQFLANEIRDSLIGLGWLPEDIAVTLPAGPDDPSFTPESVLNQQGYGIVVFIGMGGRVKDEAGDVHYMMQCFGGGEYEDGYQDYVTPARWAEYEAWIRDGRLINGELYNAGTGQMQEQVFIRGDLLAEQIQVDDGAVLHFISSASRDDEVLSGIDSAGAVSGWSDIVNPWDGKDSFLQLIENMMGDDSGARSDADALALLHDQGMDEQDYLGRHSVLGGTAAPGFYLSTQLAFAAPIACLPPGTVYYDVTLTFADCPAFDQAFDFFPGGEFSLPALPPYGGEIALKAVDASGTTLGAGLYDLALGGGPDEYDLCPCEASVLVVVHNLPPGTEQQYYDIDYDDPSIPAVSRLSDPGDSDLANLIPGTATLRVEASASAEPLGYYEKSGVELSCEGSAEHVCFGWLSLTPAEVPDGTSYLVVSAESAHETPDPVTIPPSGTTPWYGFETYSYPNLTVKAYDSANGYLGEISFQVFVDCGENEALIDFDTFGLILTATPQHAHLGWEQVVLAAELREWTDYDTTEPTGDPVPGLTVFFETDLGHFVGPDDAESGENGVASVLLSSDDAGIATVIARCGPAAADTVTVDFAAPLSYIVDRQSGDYHGGTPPYPDGWLEKYCTYTELWWNGGLRWYWPNLQHAYSYFTETNPAVGDTLRFVFSPDLGCPEPGNEPPFDSPWISDVWLHYWYGADYDRQITVQVTPERIPLLETLEVKIELQDPWVKRNASR